MNDAQFCKAILPGTMNLLKNFHQIHTVFLTICFAINVAKIPKIFPDILVYIAEMVM